MPNPQNSSKDNEKICLRQTPQKNANVIKSPLGCKSCFSFAGSTSVTNIVIYALLDEWKISKLNQGESGVDRIDYSSANVHC